jgi:predicted flap endonuclease-1-like 5' DNA nuclease
MFVGAGVLGYIIGYRSGESKTFLQNQLSSLQSQLESCKASLVKSTPINTSTISIPTIAHTYHTMVEKPDDLKKIEGIGPKIEELLNQNGILTFIQLSQASTYLLKQILQEATRFQMHDPSTWPRQAELASAGKWQELKEWQDILNKGKE